MKLLLINQPLHNRGDESAHKGLLRSLLKLIPDVSIDVVIYDDDWDTINQFAVVDKRVHYHNFQPRILPMRFFSIVKYAVQYNWNFLYHFYADLKRISQFYKDADYVICAPGGISMGGFQNIEHLYALYYAKHFNKPLAYFGRSFGPFPTDTAKQKTYKELSEKILNYFSFLSIRDKQTELLAQQMGLKYVSTVDSAFLDAPKVDIPNSVQEQISNKYIVFVPNVLIWHYNYRNRISYDDVISYFSRMANILIKKYPAHKIVLLPQTFNYKDKLRDDINFFNELKKNVASSEIVVLSDQFSSDLQQTIISKAACVVGARYHSIVFSLNNNTPFVALSYEHKITGLLEALGKQECMLDIVHAMDNQANVDASLLKFKMLLNNLKKDENAMKNAKAIAEDGLSLLIEDIKDKLK